MLGHRAGWTLAVLFALAELTSCGSKGGNSSGGAGSTTPTGTITSVAVSAVPSSITATQTTTCTATVQGTGGFNTNVTWTATGGSLNVSTGDFVVLTPSGVGTMTCKATSTEDTSKSGSATVTVTAAPPPTSVIVSCTPSTVPDGQTSQCTATVQGPNGFDPTVTWTASLGTIASTGKDASIYTAPSSTTGSSTVTATSLADTTKSGSSSLNVVIPPPANAFRIVGPPGGLFSALAADPTSPGTVYASTEGFGAPGQFLKSTDGAKTWQLILQGPASLTAAGVDSIAVSQVSGTVYVGGDGPIYTSINRGTTWSQIPLPTPAESVALLSVDPLNDGNLYAIFNGNGGILGLYISRDAGANWSQLSASCGNYFVADPKTEGTIYCTGSSGFFVSTDGGATWTNKSAITGMSLASFAVVPSNPKQIYLIAGYPGTTVAFLYSSTDGGATWSQLKGAGDVESVHVDATNPLNLFVTSLIIGYERSTDGGNTWTTSANVPWGNGLLIQITGSPSTLLGDFGGDIFSSQDNGATWSEAGNGISDHWGYQVAVDPQSPQTIYLAVGNTGGIYKSTNSGNTWTHSYHSDNCNAISVDPRNSNHLIAGCTTNKLIVSNDGGSSWQSASLNFVGSGVFSIALAVFDPNSPGTIYLGVVAQGGPTVAKSIDNGVSWSLIGNGLPSASSTENVWSFAISPSDSNVLLVGIQGTTMGIY